MNYATGYAVGRSTALRQPVYDSTEDPLTTRRRINKVALGSAGAATVPAYLYARGLRTPGVPWKRVPQVLKRDIAALRTHEVAKGKLLHGSLAPFTSTMREGVIGTGHDIAAGGRRIWEGVKSGYRGFRGVKALSAKLDDIIEFKER